MADRQSQRQSARTGHRSSERGPAPERPSQRGMGNESRRSRSVRTQGASGGKALIYCLGVILLLGVVVVVLSIQKSGEKREFDRLKRQAEETKEKNIDRAYAAFKQAEQGALNFVMGRDDKATDEAIFAGVKGNSNVYNVIVERQFKVKNRDQHDTRKVDANRTTVDKANQLATKEGINITAGFVENRTVPVVIAEKHYTGEPGDKVNLGGDITVVVNGVKD